VSIFGHFRRKNPDGTKTFGFGAYLVFGAVIFGGLAWSTYGTMWGTRTEVTQAAPPPDPARGVKLGAVAQSAANLGATDFAPHDDDKLKSDRGIASTDTSSPQESPAEPRTSMVSAFESMNAAAKSTTVESKPTLDEGGMLTAKSDGYAPLAPTYVAQSNGSESASRPQISIAKLVRKATASTTVPATQASPGTASAPAAKIVEFVPRGETLEVVLLNTIETGQLDSYIELGVIGGSELAKKYFGRLVGGKIIAASSKTGVRDRIQITASAIRFSNKQELPLRGIAKELDGATGIRAYYIPAPDLVQLAPYANNFQQAFTELIASRYEQSHQTTVSLGGVGVQVTPVSDAAKVEAVRAASTAVRDFAQRRIDELEARYAAHLVVPAGTRFLVQLTSNFDVAALYDPSAETIAVGATVLPSRPEEIEEERQAARVLSGKTLSGLDTASGRATGPLPGQVREPLKSGGAFASPAGASQQSDFFSQSPAK